MSGQIERLLVLFLYKKLMQNEIANAPISNLPMDMLTDDMQRLVNEKKSAREFQERRHLEWNENYELYRSKTRTNRLTQRQAVNVPLMKETLKTILSNVDEPPLIEWKELSGDPDKELYFQEIWNDDFDRLNLPGVDIQDKKSVLLYGRSFKKLNWVDNAFDVQVLDIFDVIIDPMVTPLDIETARFIVHQNIFRSVRDILADDRYTEAGKNSLKTWLLTKQGMVQTAQNREELMKKHERLKAMGVSSTSFAKFAGGDVIVNLTEHYTHQWDEKKMEFVRRVYTYAEDSIPLLDDTLEELLGVTFWPFVSWGEDIESQDFWSDALADLVRVPNKIINVWFSQLVENRTLKNFQMHWYDATIQGYQPQTYEPGPGRMLPAPGDPNKTILPVAIDGLDDTMKAIDFLTKMIESGTAATAIEKGETPDKSITLGEVQILVGKAMERTVSMAKFYRRAWQEFCMKYQAIVSANATGSVTLYKASRDGKLWPKTLYASDWKSDKGYRAVVRSTSEQEEEKTKAVQRFQFLLKMFPGNPVLTRIAQRRSLGIVELTPEEIREVEEAQKQMDEQKANAELAVMTPKIEPTAPVTPTAPAPTNPQADGGGDQEISKMMQELANL